MNYKLEFKKITSKLGFIFQALGEKFEPKVQSEKLKIGIHFRKEHLNHWIRKAKRFYKIYGPKKGLKDNKNTEGYLRNTVIFKISLKNLIHAKSRTLVTVAAIAIGTAAIFVLVSFAYGLQALVTSRIVQPNALRLAEVQSDSTSLTLNQETLSQIRQISGIQDAAASVSLAGTVSQNNSRSDVVVVGLTNRYMDYAHDVIISGRTFSEEAEKPFITETTGIEDAKQLIISAQEGMIAGVSDKKEPAEGERISQTPRSFKIQTRNYLPIRERPNMESKILGFTTGSVVDIFDGYETWGSDYQSVTTSGRSLQKTDGNWMGKWVQVKLPAYEETAPSAYHKMKDSDDNDVLVEGYITYEGISLLNKEDADLDKMINVLLDKEPVVKADGSDGEVSAPLAKAPDANTETVTEVDDLVEADKSDSSKVLGITTTDDTKTLDELKEIIDKDLNEEPLAVENAVVAVKKKTGNEVLLSSALLSLWEKTPEEMIGKQIDISYIVSGTAIPGITGRVISDSVQYTVVGIINDPNKQKIYVPISDLESMGVERYTNVKVLATSEDSLKGSREKIESLGFATQSVVDTLIPVDILFRVIRFLLASFGVIALLVAIFGVFNTLTVSLLERTREIGVMKTMGTTDRDVAKLFVSESMLLGIFGGITGILLGYLIGMVIDFLLSLFRDQQDITLFQTPTGFLVLLFAISVLIGVLTGIYPSYRAKKISALDALRYE